MRTVAIVGGGLCGLATAVFCIQNGLSVHLYDRSAIGGGASGIAAGLLHSYSGAHAKKNRGSSEGMLATFELLQLAQQYSTLPIYQQKGLYRLAFTAQQREDYQKSALLYPDVEWIENIQTILPYASAVSAIYISSAMVVQIPLYLQALWAFCKEQGAKFFVQDVEETSLLKEDAVVLTCGDGLLKYKELRATPVKGQLIKLAWPDIEVIPCPISSKVYIVMEGEKSCFVGGTFEKEFASVEPDIKVASELLLGAAEQLYPPLKGASVLGCMAGIRVSTSDHLPIFGRMQDGVYYLGGMGSKGLLYHADYAKKLLNLLPIQLFFGFFILFKLEG